jgi:phage terminase small subunit
LPRRSADASIIPIPTRLTPPSSLAEPEKAIFTSIVSACAPKHFNRSDLPLLVAYCEAAAMSEQAAAELRKAPIVNGKPSPWLMVQEKSVRAMVALALGLRLSPQARAPTQPIKPSNPASAYDVMSKDDER